MNPESAPSPPPAKSAQRTVPPKEIYGDTLLTLADALGLHPLDVALTTTSVIGNLAGPKAAVLDVTGRRVVPGFNIIQIGDTAARFQALQDRLVEPVRTSQDWIRKAVSGCSRKLTDMSEFGWNTPEKNGNHDLTADEMATRTRRHESRKWSAEMLQHGIAPPDQSKKPMNFSCHEFTGERPRDPGPGVFHLPSVLLEGLRLDEIVGALGEVHGRRAFVFDPAGVLWETPSKKKRTPDNTATLAGLLRGQDCRFGPVHSNQGHGTWWHASIGIYSSVMMDRLGQFLSEPGHSQTEALEQCLLVKLRAADPGGSGNATSSDACAKYSSAIARILGNRLSDADGVNDSISKHSSTAAGFQRQIFQTCEQDGAAFPRHVAHLHDLAYRILWPLSVLRKDDPPADVIHGAFLIARAAIRRHVELIAAAKQHWADHARLESAQRVQAIVKRKGPSTLRDMLRSTNIQRTDRLMPGIEFLLGRHQLRQDRLGKYHLVEKSSSREETFTTQPMTVN